MTITLPNGFKLRATSKSRYIIIEYAEERENKRDYGQGTGEAELLPETAYVVQRTSNLAIAQRLANKYVHVPHRSFFIFDQKDGVFIQ